MQPISIWQFGPQCGPRRTRWKPPHIPSSYDVAHCHRHRCRRRIILPPCKFTDNISVASHSLTRVIYVVRNGTLASRGALICGSIRTPEPPLLNNGAPILPSHCPRVHPMITNMVRVSQLPSGIALAFLEYLSFPQCSDLNLKKVFR